MKSSPLEAGRSRYRLLKEGERDPYSNLAMEEALFNANGSLILRFWENERAVIIGRAQIAKFETDLQYCVERSIPVVRRFTAGGAVYNGPGNLNWSLFVGRGVSGGRIVYSWSAMAMFRMVGGVVAEALARIGVRAWLEAPNRILTPGGKVSGMAAYLSKNGLLCHGTMLLHADLDEARRLTTPSELSLERRYVRSRAAKMANVGSSPDAFIASMSEVVGEEVGEEIVKGEHTPDEVEMMNVLRPKYTDPGWNLGDPFEGSSA